MNYYKVYFKDEQEISFMLGGEIIIKLDNHHIYLNDETALSYHNVNLPKEHFKFKTHKALYWRLKVKQYDKETNTLHVDVLDYDCAELESFNLQLAKDIKNIVFGKLDWKQLERLLFVYTLNQLKDSLVNVYDLSEASLKRTAPNLFFAKREPYCQTVEVEKRVKFEEATFGKKKITFTIRLKKPALIKELEIKNDHLKPEFENIKPWFEKKIGKSFMVNIIVTSKDYTVEEVKASSVEIDGIDENTVKAFEVQSVLNLTKLLHEEHAKTSYSLNELLDANTDQSIRAISASDILEIFINNGKAKNLKQLEYLSKNKHSLNESLRFTLKPMFGFLFNTADEFCVWELLNSHATYIWKKDRAYDEHSDVTATVDEAIAIIQTQGREAYKKYYKSLATNLYAFHVIEHESIGLTEEERFNEWKKKFELIVSNPLP